MRAMGAFLVCFCALIAGGAAQGPAPDVSVLRPTYGPNGGPAVAVDSGHFNYHTIDGLYAPFAAVLRNDGFQVSAFTGRFTPESLSANDVLVISNALPTGNLDTLKAPIPSAFTPDEIENLKRWVSDGGSLLLITDHRPIAGANFELARAFGFDLRDGAAQREQPLGPPSNREVDFFSLADRTLADDIVTRGRNPDEAVTRIRTFLGTGFRAPPEARPIIVLPRGFFLYDCPQIPCPGAITKSDGEGYLQGAVLKFGNGRMALFGEAAMFSAQLIPLEPPFPVGFNSPGAEQNKQFTLNLMHWLAGDLPD